MRRRHLIVLAPVLVVAELGPGPAALAQEDGDPADTGAIDLDAFILDIEATILDLEYGTAVTESPEQVTITLEADVFFDFDRHELRPDAVDALTDVVEQIQEDEAIELEISGHTDSDGSDDYNQGLSQRRARSVEAFLADRLDGVTMTTEGFGESEPVASNDTEEGRAQNRRVEITYPQ